MLYSPVSFCFVFVVLMLKLLLLAAERVKSNKVNYFSRAIFAAGTFLCGLDDTKYEQRHLVIVVQYIQHVMLKNILHGNAQR